MAIYYVEVPVVMKLQIGVKADSEQEALDKVFENPPAISPEDDNAVFEYIDWEWEMYERVTSGNVYHGLCHEAYAELESEDEDED